MEGNCFDRKAFAADMLELYADAVFRLAVTRLRNRADAEDTVQEVFLRLYRSGVCFQDTEHVKAWLLRVTVNYCRSLGRSPWKRKVLPAENVSAAVSDRQDRCVVTAVLALPVRYRDVIYLFYYEGYSTAEIQLCFQQRAAARC